MDAEDVMRRAGHEGLPIEERWVDCAEDDGGCREEVAAAKVGSKRTYYENDDDDRKFSSHEHTDSSKQLAATVAKKEKFNLETDSKASSSSKKEQDHQLESARAKMGEVREENQRLKMHLDRIMKDYRTLQMQFNDVVQQEQTEKSTDDTVDDHHLGNEESELISLSLGRSSSEPKKDGKSKGKDQTEQVKEGLSLGLDCPSFDVSKSDTNETLPNPSPMNSFEEQKEEAGETWPPSKILKTMRSGDHDEVVQQNPGKKARVSVRARCDTPTMNDGCQWRKYGQKIAKGNPCPRAYYRCTVAPLCPVRKQVQRCPEDMSILVTTYEGTHNHPLPISATAMASTTSAAASMLLSGPNPSSNSSTIAADLHGRSYYLSDNSKSKPFYLHNSSSLSSSSPYPTITLDLTSNPSSSSSSSHFNRYSSSYPTIRKFDSTSCLNFGASNPSNAISWANGFLSYGSTTSQSYDRNQFGKLNPSVSTSQQLVFPVDTIAAATKAITTDPSFQSALTAALNSILSTGNSTTGANLDALKWGDQFPVANGLTSASTAKGSPCAVSYLNNTNSTNSQPGSFVPPSLPFSTAPRSASSSPADNKDRPH